MAEPESCERALTRREPTQKEQGSYLLLVTTAAGSTCRALGSSSSVSLLSPVKKVFEAFSILDVVGGNAHSAFQHRGDAHLGPGHNLGV
jgi:hypothetical protein